jgi:hypothetical protein
MVFFFYEKIGCYRTIFSMKKLDATARFSLTGKLDATARFSLTGKLKSFFNFFLYHMFDLRLEKNAQPLYWRI